ncbi:MAG TPA: sugar phosphate isomerase/epimerase family protein [Bryobacteraceae bacterium]|nr:sugar phosphate isomerase/epimerase family protein [Bryobacteraceae bacterium]
MKFGVNTFIWSAGIDGELLERFPAIRRAGFDGVELPMIRPERVPLAEVRRSLADNGLECTLCSVLPQELSAISDDAAVRQRTREHLAECVRVAAEAGARMVAGPLYSPVGYLPGRRRTEDEWQRAVECYQWLGETLESHDVTIAVEPLNRFETYFLNTAADAVRLAGEVGHPNVGVLFDTFHANIEEKDVAAALISVAGCLKHFHACENDRGTPGSGHVDWTGVFQALEKAGYSGWVTIESFGFALGELSAAASIWRDLAPTAESIAFDGVKFLKRGLELQAARA